MVSGRVQGVWFRSSTREVALSLGLTGYVCNRPDGSVEAVFEGPEDRVRRAVEWCRHGPGPARVDSVDVSWGQATGKYRTFLVEY